MSGWVVVAGDFVPHGGMDRANLEWARHLANRGRVEVVTHRADPDLAADPNVTVCRVPRPLGSRLLGEPLLARAGHRAARRAAAAGGRVVANGGNCRWPDVNWVHYVHAAFTPPPSGGPLRRAKARAAGAWARATERAALRTARLALCNSRRTARDVIERFGVNPDRVRVVYLGTDPAEFGPVSAAGRSAARRELGWEDRPWAVFVGGLGDTRKGFDVLYPAWQELCRDPRWDANLAVTGRGAGLPEWQARAAADGLTDRVRFLGFRSDVPRLLAATDVLVHPARYDAYGLAPHEALCRGIPAIVSAATGVSERYPGSLSGLVLTDPESPSELADQLRYWWAHADSLPGVVRPFADELRGRTWADMAREMYDLIQAS